MMKQYWLWFGLIFAIIIGAVWQYYPLQDAQKRLEKLPIKGLEYQGKDVPLTELEQSFLGDINLVKRLYKVGNQNLFVTVLDGTKNRHVVHDPFYCFRGSGWTLLSKEEVPLNAGYATLLSMKKNDQEKEALVWFSDGKSQFTSPLRYWMEATLRRLTLGTSGEEPVLIVVQPVGKRDLDWEEVKQKFQPLFHL